LFIDFSLSIYNEFWSENNLLKSRHIGLQNEYNLIQFGFEISEIQLLEVGTTIVPSKFSLE